MGRREITLLIATCSLFIHLIEADFFDILKSWKTLRKHPYSLNLAFGIWIMRNWILKTVRILLLHEWLVEAEVMTKKNCLIIMDGIQ
jgi:hypothetical protein